MKIEKISIGPKLRNWQEECVSKLTRFFVMVIHRRAGKSELALLILVQACLQFSKNGNFCYFMPQKGQLEDNIWPRIVNMLKPLSDIEKVKLKATEFTITFIDNNTTLRMFGTNNATRIRGNHFDGVVIDETADIDKDTWEKIIMPTLTDKDKEGWCIFLGTPNGQNLFWDLWLKAEDPNLKQWSGVKYTVYDTDAISKNEIELIQQTISEEAFAQEYLCDFNVAATNQLISVTDTLNALKLRYDIADMRDYPLILGVDVARYGQDRSVLYPRLGLYAYEPIVYYGLDNMELASVIANWIETYKPDAVFIDSGAGAGVIDRLRQLGYDNIFEVIFGGKASDDKRYKNKRIECWDRTKSWIKNGGSLQDKTTADELVLPTYSYDEVGRMKLESKDDIKKRLKKSPDCADALTLTFADPVHKTQGKGYQYIKCNDYNPLEQFSKEAM